MLATTLSLVASLQGASPDLLFRLDVPNTPTSGYLHEAPDLDGDGQVDFSWHEYGEVRSFSSRTRAPLQAVQSIFIGQDFAWIGDANGDGHRDILSTAPANGPGYQVIDGVTGAYIYGVQSGNVPMPFSAFGRVPDHDGDGQSDFWLLMRPTTTSEDRVIEIYSTVSGALIRSITRQDAPFFGSAIASYPDADGDGLSDFLVGETVDLITSRGLIVSSVTGADLVECLCMDPGGSIARDLHVIGDVNRDGAMDILARKDRPSVDDDAVVYSGATGAELFALPRPAPATLNYGTFGRFAANLGDIDGDHHDDFVVSDDRSAKIVVFSGASGRELRSMASTGVSGLGRGLLGPVDIDGDGVGDWITGHPWNPTGTQGTFTAEGYRWIDDDMVIDFEEEVNGGAPIRNGKALDQESPRTQPLRILAGSYGTFEVAAFDTSTNGPNSGGAGAELLVDSGNAVIVQAAPQQTIPGIFDQPSPGANGGEYTIRFDQACEPLSIDLIHVPVGLSMELVAIDAAQRSRTFSVPGGFTTTLSVSPAMATWTLQFDTLTPQPGASGTATALEDAGFNPGRVRSLIVRSSGPSAIDRLRVARLLIPPAGTLQNQIVPSVIDGAIRVFGLRDVTGDRRADFVIATRGSMGPSGTPDAVTAYSGEAQVVLYSIQGARGETLAQLGDLTGDGFGELAIGWAGWSNGNGYAPGEVLIHDGATGAFIDRLEGTSDGDRFGLTVAALDDVDGDGIDDFAVGAPGHAGATGRIEIISGGSRLTLRTIVGPAGTPQERRMGTELVSMDDVDGDGVRDIAVTFMQPSGTEGRVRIYSTATGQPLMDVALAAPCMATEGLFAFTDQDGDGLEDLLVQGGPVGCSTLVISSVTGAEISSMPPNEFFTRTIVPGDIDGDRRDDIIRLESLSDFVTAYRGYSGLGFEPLFDESTFHQPGTEMSIFSMDDIDRDGRHDFALIHPNSTIPLRFHSLDATLWTVCNGAAYGGGLGARLRTVGSSSISANTLALETWNLPNTSFALLLNASATVPGTGPGSIAIFSDGNLCLSPTSLARHSTIFPVIGNASLMPVDLSALPTAGAPGFVAAANAGETRFWQCWFRDPGGFFGSNLSDAVGVTFSH